MNHVDEMESWYVAAALFSYDSIDITWEQGGEKVGLASVECRGIVLLSLNTRTRESLKSTPETPNPHSIQADTPQRLHLRYTWDTPQLD